MICSKDEAKIIYYTSFSSLIGGLIQIYYYNTYYLALGTLSVFCSSILYWSNPIYGIRRNIDIIIVSNVFLYYMYHSLYLVYPYLYYFFTGIALLSYYIGCKEAKKGNSVKGTYYHCLVHIVANLGNISFYYTMYRVPCTV